MHENIAAVAEHYLRHGFVMLNEDATRRLIPSLDEAIRRFDGKLPADFFITQNGYGIKNISVTHSGATYSVSIHYMQKQGEPQEAGAPAPHRRRSA